MNYVTDGSPLDEIGSDVSPLDDAFADGSPLDKVFTSENGSSSDKSFTFLFPSKKSN